ncbi:endonuclease III [Candidatus Saccharibacteria bacterium]|nr:MAG: endonuclease III [Candidatus Saccharibacteria bacterium]
MNQSSLDDFRATVWDFYAKHPRIMPWRTNTDPYWVLVSEVMLQQTQVTRVIPKFEAFVAALPTVKALAEVDLAFVLQLWSGLGYNRRAKYLHQAARVIQQQFDGEIPRSQEALVSLPGIGRNTAAAIVAYSSNSPSVFVETNIRTVYINHFFSDRAAVDDAEILQLVTLTLDRDSPREWYWALMDYGTFLKQSKQGALDQSRQFKKQTPFAGSMRQMRGRIIKVLSEQGGSSEQELSAQVDGDDRFAAALQALIHEGLICRELERFHLTGDRVNSDNRTS